MPTKLAKDSLYLVVGLGVLAAREVNIRRPTIERKISEATDALPDPLRTVAVQVNDCARQLVAIGESTSRDLLKRVGLG